MSIEPGKKFTNGGDVVRVTNVHNDTVTYRIKSVDGMALDDAVNRELSIENFKLIFDSV